MLFGEFKEHFEKGLKANHFMAFFCNCTSRYSGRAESDLGKGDRMILVKPGNVFQLHQPDGNTPVHWMKSGAEILLEKSENHLALKVHHIRTKAVSYTHLTLPTN